MQGAARIGIGDYEHARTPFQPNAEASDQSNFSFLKDWDQLGHTYMPIAAYGTTDPDVASRISAQMNKQLNSAIFADEANGGLIGYIDVPIAEANAPYAREQARVARITPRTKGEAQTVHYRVEPGHLGTLTPEPLHMPSQYIDGQKVFGVPHTEVINNWARAYVKRWQSSYMSPERDEVLSEMLIPQLLDHDYPLISPTGERTWQRVDVRRARGPDERPARLRHGSRLRHRVTGRAHGPVRPSRLRHHRELDQRDHPQAVLHPHRAERDAGEREVRDGVTR